MVGYYCRQMTSRLNDRKSSVDGVESASVLIYEKAFHVIRLYTEQVC